MMTTTTNGNPTRDAIEATLGVWTDGTKTFSGCYSGEFDSKLGTLIRQKEDFCVITTIPAAKWIAFVNQLKDAGWTRVDSNRVL